MTDGVFFWRAQSLGFLRFLPFWDLEYPDHRIEDLLYSLLDPEYRKVPEIAIST